MPFLFELFRPNHFLFAHCTSTVASRPLGRVTGDEVAKKNVHRETESVYALQDATMHRTMHRMQRHHYTTK